MDILSHVIPVMVASDEVLENTEVFYGRLKLPQGSMSNIMLIPPAANVTIIDNNNAVIGFSGNYTVIEGGTINLELVLLSGSLGREVIVSISTNDSTAQGKSFIFDSALLLPY